LVVVGLVVVGLVVVGLVGASIIRRAAHTPVPSLMGWPAPRVGRQGRACVRENDDCHCV
jgi:hypothetical protein